MIRSNLKRGKSAKSKGSGSVRVLEAAIEGSMCISSGRRMVKSGVMARTNVLLESRSRAGRTNTHHYLKVAAELNKAKGVVQSESTSRIL